MIKPINSIAKKAILGTMLLGATAAGINAKTTNKMTNPQYTEISKEASSAISSNAIAGINQQQQSTVTRNKPLDELFFSIAGRDEEFQTFANLAYASHGSYGAAVILSSVINATTMKKALSEAYFDKLFYNIFDISTEDWEKLKNLDDKLQVLSEPGAYLAGYENTKKADYEAASKAVDNVLTGLQAATTPVLQQYQAKVKAFEAQNGSTTPAQKMNLFTYKLYLVNYNRVNNLIEHAKDDTSANTVSSKKVLNDYCNTLLEAFKKTEPKPLSK